MGTTGQSLNRVARLLATAHGGQTLFSEVTHGLVRDALPPNATLLSLGAHRLKDLGRPETVFQLLHPALPAEFLPLNSLDNPALPNNLPQQATSFIGREKQVEEVKTRLTKTRLLTRTGAGGPVSRGRILLARDGWLLTIPFGAGESRQTGFLCARGLRGRSLHRRLGGGAGDDAGTGSGVRSERRGTLRRARTLRNGFACDNGDLDRVYCIFQ